MVKEQERQRIIEEEKAAGAKGDHFAPSGSNDRIWNAFQKHGLKAPENFLAYYANPLLALVNEAAHCLEEGILREPMAGDLGAIMGIGFPPMLGGPLFHADVRGVGGVVEQLREYAQAYGKRFEPSALLVRHAEAGKPIHG